MSSLSYLLEARKLRWSSGVISALLYGGWAVIQNLDTALTHLFVIALSQGAVSFAATFLFSSVIYYFVFIHPRDWLAWYWVALSAAAAYMCILLSVHWMVGTPNLAMTVVPILALATAYAFYFAKRTDIQLLEKREV